MVFTDADSSQRQLSCCRLSTPDRVPPAADHQQWHPPAAGMTITLPAASAAPTAPIVSAAAPTASVAPAVFAAPTVPPIYTAPATPTAPAINFNIVTNVASAVAPITTEVAAAVAPITTEVALAVAPIITEVAAPVAPIINEMAAAVAPIITIAPIRTFDPGTPTELSTYEYIGFVAAVTPTKSAVLEERVNVSGITSIEPVLTSNELAVTAKKLALLAKELANSSKEQAILRKELDLSTKEQALLAKGLVHSLKYRAFLRKELVLSAKELAIFAKEIFVLGKELDFLANELALSANELALSANKLALSRKEFTLSGKEPAISAKELELWGKQFALSAKEFALWGKEIFFSVKVLALSGKEPALLAKELSISAKELAVSEKVLALSAKVLALSTKEFTISAKEYVLSVREQALSAIELALSAKELDLSAKEFDVAVKELALSANELTLSTNEFALSAKEYALSGREQALSANELALSARELALSANELTLSTNEFALSANELALSAIEFAISTNEFAISANELAISAKELAFSERELALSAKEFALSAKEFALSAKEFAFSAKEFALSAKEFALSAKEFALSAKEFALSAKEFALSAKKFALSAKEFALSAKEFAHSAREFALSAKEFVLSAKVFALSAKEFALTAKELALSEKELALSAKEFALSIKELVISVNEFALARKEFVLSAKEFTLSVEEFAILAKEVAPSTKELSLSAKEVAHSTKELTLPSTQWMFISRARKNPLTHTKLTRSLTTSVTNTSPTASVPITSPSYIISRVREQHSLSIVIEMEFNITLLMKLTEAIRPAVELEITTQAGTTAHDFLTSLQTSLTTSLSTPPPTSLPTFLSTSLIPLEFTLTVKCGCYVLQRLMVPSVELVQAAAPLAGATSSELVLSSARPAWSTSTKLARSSAPLTQAATTEMALTSGLLSTQLMLAFTILALPSMQPVPTLSTFTSSHFTASTVVPSIVAPYSIYASSALARIGAAKTIIIIELTEQSAIVANPFRMTLGENEQLSATTVKTMTLVHITATVKATALAPITVTDDATALANAAVRARRALETKIVEITSRAASTCNATKTMTVITIESTIPHSSKKQFNNITLETTVKSRVSLIICVTTVPSVLTTDHAILPATVTTFELIVVVIMSLDDTTTGTKPNTTISTSALCNQIPGIFMQPTRFAGLLITRMSILNNSTKYTMTNAGNVSTSHHAHSFSKTSEVSGSHCIDIYLTHRAHFTYENSRTINQEQFLVSHVELGNIPHAKLSCKIESLFNNMSRTYTASTCILSVFQENTLTFLLQNSSKLSLILEQKCYVPENELPSPVDIVNKNVLVISEMKDYIGHKGKQTDLILIATSKNGKINECIISGLPFYKTFVQKPSSVWTLDKQSDDNEPSFDVQVMAFKTMLLSKTNFKSDKENNFIQLKKLTIQGAFEDIKHPAVSYPSKLIILSNIMSNQTCDALWNNLIDPQDLNLLHIIMKRNRRGKSGSLQYDTLIENNEIFCKLDNEDQANKTLNENIASAEVFLNNEKIVISINILSEIQNTKIHKKYYNDTIIASKTAQNIFSFRPSSVSLPSVTTNVAQAGKDEFLKTLADDRVMKLNKKTQKIPILSVRPSITAAVSAINVNKNEVIKLKKSSNVYFKIVKVIPAGNSQMKNKILIDDNCEQNSTKHIKTFDNSIYFPKTNVIGNQCKNQTIFTFEAITKNESSLSPGDDVRKISAPTQINEYDVKTKSLLDEIKTEPKMARATENKLNHKTQESLAEAGELNNILPANEENAINAIAMQESEISQEAEGKAEDNKQDGQPIVTVRSKLNYSDEQLSSNIDSNLLHPNLSALLENTPDMNVRIDNHGSSCTSSYLYAQETEALHCIADINISFEMNHKLIIVTTNLTILTIGKQVSINIQDSKVSTQVVPINYKSRTNLNQRIVKKLDKNTSTASPTGISVKNNVSAAPVDPDTLNTGINTTYEQQTKLKKTNIESPSSILIFPRNDLITSDCQSKKRNSTMMGSPTTTAGQMSTPVSVVNTTQNNPGDRTTGVVVEDQTKNIHSNYFDTEKFTRNISRQILTEDHTKHVTARELSLQVFTENEGQRHTATNTEVVRSSYTSIYSNCFSQYAHHTKNKAFSLLKKDLQYLRTSSAELTSFSQTADMTGQMISAEFASSGQTATMSQMLSAGLASSGQTADTKYQMSSAKVARPGQTTNAMSQMLSVELTISSETAEEKGQMLSSKLENSFLTTDASSKMFSAELASSFQASDVNGSMLPLELASSGQTTAPKGQMLSTEFKCSSQTVDVKCQSLSVELASSGRSPDAKGKRLSEKLPRAGQTADVNGQMSSELDVRGKNIIISAELGSSDQIINANGQRQVTSEGVQFAPSVCPKTLNFNVPDTTFVTALVLFIVTASILAVTFFLPVKVAFSTADVRTKKTHTNSFLVKLAATVAPGTIFVAYTTIAHVSTFIPVVSVSTAATFTPAANIIPAKIISPAVRLQATSLKFLSSSLPVALAVGFKPELFSPPTTELHSNRQSQAVPAEAPTETKEFENVVNKLNISEKSMKLSGPAGNSPKKMTSLSFSLFEKIISTKPATTAKEKINDISTKIQVHKNLTSKETNFRRCFKNRGNNLCCSFE